MLGVTTITIREWLLRALLALLVAYVLFFSIGYTLEYRVELKAVQWLTATRIALLLLACGYLWLVRSEIRRLIDPFALCIIAVIVTGAASGLFGEKYWFTYLRHLFQYSFLLAFYLLGREVALRPIPHAAIKALSGTILVGYAIATVLYAATPGLQSGSYSFQPNLALLPIASGLTSGNWMISLLGSVIVVVGNKRAVYIGLSIMVAVYIAVMLERKWDRTVLMRFVVVGLTAPIIGAAFGFAVHALTSSMASFMSAPTVPTVVDRFTLQQTFNRGAQIDAAQEAKIDPVVRLTSARSAEVRVVWEMVKRSPAEALFGQGFGSQFTVEYISPNNYEPVRFDRDQADLAPVQIALTSGVPLALIFTAMLCGMVLMAFIRIGSASGVDFALALFSIGLLLDTLLGLHATNPVCWLALGIVSVRLLPDFTLECAVSSLKLRWLQQNA